MPGVGATPETTLFRYIAIAIQEGETFSARQVVERWAGSDGHRRMLQCASAHDVGVGVYHDVDNDIWLYVLVYGFDGINMSGN